MQRYVKYRNKIVLFMYNSYLCYFVEDVIVFSPEKPRAVTSLYRKNFQTQIDTSRTRNELKISIFQNCTQIWGNLHTGVSPILESYYSKTALYERYLYTMFISEICPISTVNYFQSMELKWSNKFHGTGTAWRKPSSVACSTDRYLALQGSLNIDNDESNRSSSGAIVEECT